MTVLTEQILDDCAARAAGYDRDNRFFTEDFEELRPTGYLLMAVPTELGGLGMTLAEVCQEETPPGSPLAGDRTRPQHARVLDGRGRRPVAQRRQEPQLDARRGCGR